MSTLVVLGARRTDAELKRALDQFISTSDRASLARGDPVDLVRQYSDPHDQEVAGLMVAMLAYGRVSSIKSKARAVLDVLGARPAEGITEKRRLRKLSGFVYRFQRGEDVPQFLGAIARLRAQKGSLAAAFVEGDLAVPEGRPNVDYREAMGCFVRSIEQAIRGDVSPGLRFLLPQVERGGAAKRLCLYLRWMIRDEDGVDTGAWGRLVNGLTPRRLLVPLDTHIERISRYLGLTERRTGGLKTTVEITESLRRLCPEDPLIYDLALCHLGISGRCPRKRDVAACADCAIRSVCRLGAEPRSWPYRL